MFDVGWTHHVLWSSEHSNMKLRLILHGNLSLVGFLMLQRCSKLSSWFSVRMAVFPNWESVRPVALRFVCDSTILPQVGVCKPHFWAHFGPLFQNRDAKLLFRRPNLLSQGDFALVLRVGSACTRARSSEFRRTVRTSCSRDSRCIMRTVLARAPSTLLLRLLKDVPVVSIASLHSSQAQNVK